MMHPCRISILSPCGREWNYLCGDIYFYAGNTGIYPGISFLLIMGSGEGSLQKGRVAT